MKYEIKAEQLDKIIAKLKEIIIHVGYEPDTSESNIIETLKSSNCQECLRFANEIAALEQESKEQEEEPDMDFMQAREQYEEWITDKPSESKNLSLTYTYICKKCEAVFEDSNAYYDPDKILCSNCKEQSNEEKWLEENIYPSGGNMRTFRIDRLAEILQEYAQQSRRKINDILKCISKFDKTETLENKGRYFEVIQKDVRNLKLKP